MKVKKLFEGKEEKFGVKTITADDSKTVYFKTRDEVEAYFKKMKEKLGSKLKSIIKLEKDINGWGALREEVEDGALRTKISQLLQKYGMNQLAANSKSYLLLNSEHQNEDFIKNELEKYKSDLSASKESLVQKILELIKEQ